MAVKPVGDIAVDARQAAAPAEASAARLRAQGGAGAAERSFAASLPPRPAARLDSAPGAAAPDAFRRFEAMVLGQFVEAMLPKDADAAYGSGMAGDLWRSLAAEKIADEIAERGGVGIARQLMGAHGAEGQTPAGEAAEPPQGGDASGGRTASL